MLSNIKLQNFKCFEELNVPLGSINLLCGINGSGKSSLIQSLLILRQSFSSGDLLDGRLDLGGALADLGTGSDLLYEYANENRIGFGLESTKVDTPWELSFDYSPSADQLLAETKNNIRAYSCVPKNWRDEPPFGGQFQFVGAERLGPRKLHQRSETMARTGNLGVKGEFALNFLEEHRSDSLEASDPRLPGEESMRLIDVIDIWLNEISPGAHLNLETIASADAIIPGFSFDKSGDVASRAYRATNVGFGLSYVMPVILAFFSNPGDLVIIENPEAHLHPRGQTKLAELAVHAANAGVQIIIETHSDHFMDGVRIAVRDQIIASENVKMHYFERKDGLSTLTTPTIDFDGRLSSWPKGFFDQHDENLARLLAPKIIR